MAYEDFTPETRLQEAQDAKCFRIWDQSIWNGESGLTTLCIVQIFFSDMDDNIIQYDDYNLIIGEDRTKFDEYLDRDGHIVNIADLTIGGAAASERFEDGYYIIRTLYTDGTYSAGNEPLYNNPQAFLSKNRCMKRKMPAKLLLWPLTDEMYRINRDIFLQGLYLESAENSVDLGKIEQFKQFMIVIKEMFNYYKVENCW